MKKRSPFVLGLFTTALFAAAPAEAVPVAPAPNPPASEQPAASAVTLTLQDLPTGFQEVPPQIKQQLAARLNLSKSYLAEEIYR